MTTLDPGTMESRSQSIGGAEDEDTHRRFATLVTRAMGELEPDAKVLLLLYYEQGLTLDEMVSVLGTSKATLSRRLDRLRRGLREAIEASAQQELRVDSASAAGTTRLCAARVRPGGRPRRQRHGRQTRWRCLRTRWVGLIPT